jgi:GTP-binding protein
MEHLPLVSIVGRPNVGKSSLLNAICRRRVAIVDEIPGTTRDRVEVTIKHAQKQFRLVDTGGMGVVDRGDLAADVDRQITIALEEADLILFVSDVRDGVTAADRDVAERLRASAKPVLPLVNKCDTPVYEDQAAEFWALGFGEPLAVSAKELYGREELLDRIVSELPETGARPDKAVPIKIAVVGKRNVGKSTFINQLVGSERLITSEIPGTTRDSVDVPFEYKGRTFIAIDTAGVRRKLKVHESVDFYSRARTERSIRRADVVFLMLDASTDIGRVDKKLASYVESQYRPVILVVNKWDLAQARALTPEDYHAYIQELLPGLDYAPVSFISAREAFNVEPTIGLVEKLHRQAHTRATTSEVNRVIQAAVTRREPPRRGNRTLKVFYATQVRVAPPTVVAFVSDASLFDRSYIHYLANSLRAELPYDEVPVRVELRTRERSPSKHAGPMTYTPRAVLKARRRKRKGG